MTERRVPYNLLMQQKFSFAPLERQVVAMYEKPLSDEALAVALRVNSRTVARWRRCGLLFQAADKAAVTVGLHPSLVWSEWWDVPWADMELEPPTNADALIG